MPRTSNCVLCNPVLYKKFCVRMDKEYGCKAAFGCTTDAYMSCLTCPLARAFMVKYLMDLKNLSLGDAFRLCERQELDTKRAREIIQEYVTRDRRYYPEKK